MGDKCRNTLSSSHLILESKKKVRLTLVFPSSSLLPPHSWMGFSQRFQSYSCHLFLSRGIAELILGPRTELMEQMSHSPSPLPAQLKKKQKKRNKGISCVFIMTSLADRDEKLYTVFEQPSFQFLC